MSQPASVLQSVIHPKPPGQGMSMRPVAGAGREMDGFSAESEDFDLVLGVLVENAPVAMAMFDSRMRYVLANRQWINDFGLQQSLPLVGRSQFDLFPNLHPGWRSVYDRALQGHIVRSEHDVMPGPHGKSMIFRWEVRPWRRSKDSSVGGVMVTCEKFASLPQGTEIEPAEAPPAQASLPESDLPILVTDVQGLILQANKAAGKIALARGLQLGGSHFWEAFAEGPGLSTLRLEVLAELAGTARPDATLPGYITLHHATPEAPKTLIRWAISRLEKELEEGELSQMLFVGIPGEETPVLVPEPVPPPPVVVAVAPPPAAVPDAALQLENRQLEDQLANTAQDLRTLQDLERAYKRRELRQREVLDAMPCGLIVLDERGRPTFHNVQVRALFGCELKAGDTVEDWLMQACLDDSHREEVSTIWRESVWRRQLTKIVSLNTADGLVKDLEFRPTPLPQAGLLLTIHDVTDTCRLEEMLRSTEAKFRAVLHESPVAALLTDLSGAIFEANPAAETLLGHAKAELRRMGIDDWLSADSVQARRAELQRMAASRLLHGSLPVEVTRGQDDSLLLAQLRMAAVYDADGRLHSTVHYLQPQAPAPAPVEAAPPLAPAQLVPVSMAVAEAVLPSPPPTPRFVVLLSTDEQGRIRAWTAHAEDLFGYFKKEAVSKPLHQLFRPSDATGFYPVVQAGLENPGEPVPWQWYGKGGSRGVQNFQIQPEVEGGLALVLLLDRGAEFEQSIEASSETAVPTPAAQPSTSGSNTYLIGPSASHPWPVADLEREQLLLTEAHHRIKNHLQIISSLLNLQSNNLEDAGARRALRSSQNRVRAIAALHQHLYQLSLGKDASLQQFCEDLVVRLRECYDVPEQQVAVTIHLAPCEVRDEWHMPLALILNEALSNAFKHAFPNGRVGNIDVRLTTDNKQAKLTIQDDGVGLPADFDGSSSPGLGIKVIGVFAEQMQGKVSVENITDRGLIFDLRFPIGCVDN